LVEGGAQTPVKESWTSFAPQLAPVPVNGITNPYYSQNIEGIILNIRKIAMHVVDSSSFVVRLGFTLKRIARHDISAVSLHTTTCVTSVSDRLIELQPLVPRELPQLTVMNVHVEGRHFFRNQELNLRKERDGVHHHCCASVCRHMQDVDGRVCYCKNQLPQKIIPYICIIIHTITVTS
jgi:hypothetical protein